MIHVHFIIPLYNRGYMLQSLVTQLNSLRVTDTNIHIKICDHHSTDIDLSQIESGVPIEIFQHDPPFSMCCLNTAIDTVPGGDIIILTDVDLHFPATPWLQRWLSKTKQGKSYICPWVSRELVQDYIKWDTQDTGARGLVVVYASDWKRTGGLPRLVANWNGMHDSVMHNLLTGIGLTEERSCEPDIVARYHPRDYHNDAWFQGCVPPNEVDKSGGELCKWK